jgi:hypothetical protein
MVADERRHVVGGMKRQAPRIMKGFEVEWCDNLPIDGNGYPDVDAASHSFRDFASRENAVAFAKTVRDYWGAPRITPFELVPYDDGQPVRLTRKYGDEEVTDGAA